jgi:hypothetical protein
MKQKDILHRFTDTLSKLTESLAHQQGFFICA